jgi:SecD/SecF fusion protein
MIWYYGLPGFYSVVALLANLFFIIGVLSGYGAALTLPGMAGLVLTIGMAVDANVLIYERVKEEVASGKGLKAAVQNGYSAALSSIIDANITTLIAGFVLMAFGRGAVAGFAIILVIGILSSLFTAIFLTRIFIERDLEKGKDISFDTNFSKKMFNNSNFDFIANRKKFYIVSSIIILAGIVSLFTKGLSTGVDFKGGWSYIVQMDKGVSAQDIKSALNADKLPNEVKTYGTDGQFKITTTYLIDSKEISASEQVQTALLKSLSKLKVDEADILNTAKVGPTIAEDIKTDSAMAVIFAIIGMFFYIVIRFRKWSFGLGAVVALAHDVMMVFALFSIFWGIFPFPMDIDQAFIAAILTVIGYSINDTVVVFDRVREFLHIHKHESDTPDVINNAINQTLSRTLVTSFTTLLVVLILFLFGGEGLKGFTFALLVGIGVGTYSSICIATPIVVDFLKRKK